MHTFAVHSLAYITHPNGIRSSSLIKRTDSFLLLRLWAVSQCQLLSIIIRIYFLLTFLSAIYSICSVLTPVTSVLRLFTFISSFPRSSLTIDKPFRKLFLCTSTELNDTHQWRSFKMEYNLLSVSEALRLFGWRLLSARACSVLCNFT